MIILDSTVLIDLLGSKNTAETAFLKANAYTLEMAITDLVICETLQGIRSDVEYERVKATLDAFPCFDTGTKALAIAAAANYRTLRARGITIRKTIDCLIATFCMHNGYSPLHHDRDFDHFERHMGLRVVHPQ